MEDGRLKIENCKLQICLSPYVRLTAACFNFQFAILNSQSSILHSFSSSRPSVLYYERFFGVGRTVAGADNLRFKSQK